MGLIVKTLSPMLASIIFIKRSDQRDLFSANVPSHLSQPDAACGRHETGSDGADAGSSEAEAASVTERRTEERP